jgi:hypothetical protein
MLFIALTTALGPFILNFALEFTKWLTSVSSTGGKRFFLALLSILGVISFSALNGTPLDVASLTSLASTALLSLGAFLAAHGSYSLLTGKTQG